MTDVTTPDRLLSADRARRCEWHEHTEAVAKLRYKSMPDRPAGLCRKCLAAVRRNPILVGRASVIENGQEVAL